MDWAHIRLTGWRGWQQDRWIYFYHNGGPVVVVDEARGPAGAKGAVIWHLVGGEKTGAYRFRLGGSSGSAEVLLLPLDGDGRAEILERAGGSSGLDVVYTGPSGLRAAMVFLYGEWVGAEVLEDAGRLELRQVDSRTINLSLP